MRMPLSFHDVTMTYSLHVRTNIKLSEKLTALHYQAPPPSLTRRHVGAPAPIVLVQGQEGTTGLADVPQQNPVVMTTAGKGGGSGEINICSSVNSFCERMIRLAIYQQCMNSTQKDCILHRILRVCSYSPPVYYVGY